MSMQSSAVRAVRGRSALRRRAYGAATTVAILAAVEVGFRVIADGHPNPDVRLAALAVSMAAGAFVASFRRHR